MINYRSVWAGLAALGLLAGCASDVIRHPVTLHSEAPARLPHVELAQAATVQSSSGFSRELPAGSMWEFRGKIPQGSVYRRMGGIFTIEGAHVHEAFLVISGSKLVGFYLPVERAFSPAEPLTLALK